MSTWDEHLPDWWKTIDPREAFDLAGLRDAALKFAALSADDRRVEAKAFSAKYCLPKFDAPRASGFYVMLRVVFEVPSKYPAADAKYFGSWMRFGAGDSRSDDVNLAWPVSIEGDPPALTVAPFDGYAGKGYDAAGEYNYFASRFKARSVAAIEKITFGRKAN